MSQTLIKHEKESKQLATKLSQIKNQIMEDDIVKGMQRKYGGVKIINKLKMVPVTVNYHFFILNSSNLLKKTMITT